MDTSAEDAVGGGNGCPIVIANEAVFVGMYHVEVEIAGCGVTSVVEGDTVDVTRLANFRRRVYLL